VEKRTVLGIAVAFEGGLAALALRSRWPPLVRLREMIRHVVAELFARFTVADLAIVSVLAGIGEEALFRGFLQTALAGRLGTWTAVAVTSLLFGLAHFVSLTYAVYAAAVGVYLGVLLVVCDNLLVPVVVHAVFDFGALTYLVHVRRPGAG
jgi:membrane protease YdiL (CAAX protease family)